MGAFLLNFSTAWAQFLQDPAATPALLLNIVANGATIIEFIVRDIFGLLLIWAAGYLENRLRRRWRAAGAAMPASAPPIDARAPTPL